MNSFRFLSPRPRPRRFLSAAVALPSRILRVLLGCVAVLFALLAGSANGAGAPAADGVGVTPGRDWPQFLGPERNGSTSGDRVARTWPGEGPSRRWSARIGSGFAGPVVAGGRVIQFHRVAGEEIVSCFNAADGREIWRAASPTAYRDEYGFDDGPRGTPSVSGDRVVTYGAEGRLSCWDLADGRQRWSVETGALFRQRKGFFGMACSPLVEGETVIVNVGGRTGAGVVAFALSNGSVRWKATDDEASYASPVAATIAGRRRVFVLTREALVGLNPTNGALQFRLPWRPAMELSVSAATPLVIGDELFLSAGYGVGATLLRMGTGEPVQVWAKDDILSNHYATSVHREGYLYGFDGRQEQGCDLRCVDRRTGEVKWSEGGLGAGTVTLAGDRLLVLTEKGELLQGLASPAGWKVLSRAQVLPFGVRAHPALADGLLYARSKDRLVCLDLRPSQP